VSYVGSYWLKTELIVTLYNQSHTDPMNNIHPSILINSSTSCYICIAVGSLLVVILIWRRSIVLFFKHIAQSNESLFHTITAVDKSVCLCLPTHPQTDETLSDCLILLQNYCDDKQLRCKWLVGDDLVRWIEDSFNLNFKDMGFTKLMLVQEQHRSLAERLNDKNENDFWTAGVVSVVGGSCAYDSVIICLRAEGVIFPGGSWELRQCVVDTLESAFVETYNGTGPIYPNNGVGVNDSFLMTFQCVSAFAAIYSDTRSDEIRHSESGKQKQKWREYCSKLVESEVSGCTPPKKPKEVEVKGFLSLDCDVDSKHYKRVLRDFNSYKKDARKYNTWLDEFMLIFLPRVLNRNVHVYSIELRVWQEYKPLALPQHSPIFMLLNGMQYSPLIANATLRKKLWERDQ
jgi:hypothetical protein